MKRIGLAVVVVILMFLVGFTLARADGRAQPGVRRTQVALGTLVEIEVYGLDPGQANRAVEAAFAEIQRVEALANGSTHLGAGVLFPPAEIDDLLLACDTYWRLSAGAFDCGLGALIEAWGFMDGSPRVPTGEELASALAEAGWRTVRQTSEGDWELEQAVWLNFGALAKGYAVDRAAAVLAQHGVRAGLVNAGGDLRIQGTRLTAGIQHPRQADSLAGRLVVQDMAVATSGDYQQVFIQDGQRYHHILDPHSGLPAYGLQSVTVIAPTCMQADALSTAVFVLGKTAGLALVEGLPDVEALLIDEMGQKHASSGLDRYWLGE